MRNLSLDNETKYDEGDQRYKSFTALIEKDFYNKKFSLHGGIIESSFGVGNIIYYKNFELETNMFRFSKEKNNEVNRNHPWLNSYLYYNIFHFLKIKAGISDIIDRKDFITGIDVRLRDEDISYLLGLIGLSKLWK